MENILKHPVCFFSKDDCRYCELLENDLKALHIPYEKVKVTTKFRDNLVNHTKCKTVPQLFINGSFIGGYTEFSKLAAVQEHLEKVLKPVGITPIYDF